MKSPYVRAITIIASLAFLIGLTFTIGQTGLAFAQTTGGHSDCLSCHAKSNMTGKFSNGETVSLFFDASQHTDSIHVERGLGCRACHTEQEAYPHKVSSQDNCLTCHKQMLNAEEPSNDTQLVFDIPLESPRDLSLRINQSCKRCHEMQDKELVDSDHTQVMEGGNEFAPVCTDCHGFHDVKAMDGSRSLIPKMCSKCHLAVYTTYESSVHGAALDENSNPDVPTCADCHGTHVVKGPDQAEFRGDSILTCGGCHANKSLMGKYDISTEVFNTYLNDFHGRTVDSLRKSGNLKVDQATCYDCHGVHNIMAPENETSTVYPANLQHTCQQCHPDAGFTFPEAWLSHQVPDWNNNPILFAVNQFFQYFIPIMIGLFIIYIFLDVRYRLAARLGKYIEIRIVQEPEK